MKTNRQLIILVQLKGSQRLSHWYSKSIWWDLTSVPDENSQHISNKKELPQPGKWYLWTPMADIISVLNSKYFVPRSEISLGCLLWSTSITYCTGISSQGHGAFKKKQSASRLGRRWQSHLYIEITQFTQKLNGPYINNF